MPEFTTRLVPIPHTSVDQCEQDAIAELKAAGADRSPDWQALEHESWSRLQPEGGVAGKVQAFPAAIAAAAGYIAKPLIRWFIGKIDDKLQKDVAKYTAVYHGAADFQLYQRGADGPRLDYTGVRLTRLVQRGGAQVVAFDLLAQLRIVDREVLKIRPLRLFVGEVAANTEDFLGIAVSLKANATWREGREGHRLANAIEVPELLTQRVEVAGGKLPFYSTFWDPKPESDQARWASFPALPLPQWSTYEGVAYGGSHLALDVSVAEAGKVPWLLDNAAKLFHDNRDDITSLLQNAAEKALGQD